MPSRWDWGTPLMASGALSPTSSSTVGSTSITWANCRRMPPALRANLPGPRDDARNGHAALMDLALPPLQWRVAGHGPAPWIVVVAEWPTDLVDPSVHLACARRVEVREPGFVDRPLLPTFRARPVVRHDHDHRVVRFPEVVDECQHPSDLLVRVGQIGREALHEPFPEGLLLVIEVLPGGHPGWSWRQAGALRDDPDTELPGVGLLAPPIPSLGETAPVAIDPLRGRVMRGVAGARTEVEEIGLVGIDRPQISEEFDGPVGQIGAQVVAVVRRAGWPDRVIVVIERGHELVGLPTVEPVPPVEPAAQGPGGARTGHVGLVFRAEVPLADRVGGIAVSLQDLGQIAVLTGRLAPVAGVPDGQVRHPAHSAAVVVATGEQGSPGGGAQRGGVEIGQAEPPGGQAVEHRGVDIRPEAAELGESDVIQDDEDDVGRSLRWGRRRRPPRLRAAPIVPDPTAELSFRRHHTPCENTRGGQHAINGSRRSGSGPGVRSLRSRGHGWNLRIPKNCRSAPRNEVPDAYWLDRRRALPFWPVTSVSPGGCTTFTFIGRSGARPGDGSERGVGWRRSQTTGWADLPSTAGSFSKQPLRRVPPPSPRDADRQPRSRRRR